MPDAGKKSSTLTRSAFRAVWEELTPQERRIISLRCTGIGNAGVAERIFVSSQTVKKHLWRAFKQFEESGVLWEERRTVMDAICYRLGYEQALADIEARLPRRQAA